MADLGEIAETVPFTVTVYPYITITAPTIADQVYKVSDPTFTIDVGDYVWDPIDPADTWTYTITLADGSSLPAFITPSVQTTTPWATPMVSFDVFTTDSTNCG